MKSLMSLVLAFGICVNLSAQSSEIYVANKAAINGYDPVAYFTIGKAVKGTEQFTVNWKEANWWFSTQENADKFKADPEKYAPQYGGYCAYGCSRGYKAKTDPDAWTIVGGKLYLNYNTDVRTSWNKDQQAFIKKADNNWPTVRTSKF